MAVALLQRLSQELMVKTRQCVYDQGAAEAVHC